MAWVQADMRMLQNACRRIRCDARECQSTILIVSVLWAHLPELRLPHIIGFACVNHRKNQNSPGRAVWDARIRSTPRS